MLVKMSGDQIGQFWDLIKQALKISSLPSADTSEEKLLNIQKALLEGRALCWAEGDKKSPRTLVITTLSIEEISQTKNLLIYCAHGFRMATSKDYAKMIKALYLYAKSAGCDNVMMYVWNDKIVKMIKSYGGSADYTLAVLPLR